MIIKYNDEDYLVISLFWSEDNKGNWHQIFCWSLDRACTEHINFFDAKIVDGKIPPNMCLNKQKEKDDNGNIVGCSWSLENDEIFKSFWFWEAFEDNEPEANLLFRRIINEMKEFHGLPLDDLSELEEAVRKQKEEEEKNRPESEEERRQRELDEELDEYLRIGEEMEKEQE